MVHARQDYSRIQDPAINDPSLLGVGCKPIGEDEPVLLFRAQDKHFLTILRMYDLLLAQDNEQEGYRYSELKSCLEIQGYRAEEWQEEHGCKSPDLPHDPNVL
jgi:hypothetical protein